MKLRRIALAAGLVMGSSVAAAQGPHLPPPAATSALPAVGFVEFAGPGDLYSLNYEWPVAYLTVVRVGATAWSLSGWSGQVERMSETAMIGTASQLINLWRLFPGAWVEVGGGAVAGGRYEKSAGTSTRGPWLAFTGIAGLWHHMPAGRWMWRGTFTPFFVIANPGSDPGKGYAPSASVSFGYVF
jgi:hypothetical protein